MPRILSYWIEDKSANFSEFEQQITISQEDVKSSPTSTVLFPFDPNTVSKDSLVLLGLSLKTAQTILNYRKKIGRFSQKEDLKKIYTLSAKEYQKIESFIQITPKGKQFEKTTSVAAPIQVERFDFDPNTSSKEELLSLGLSQKVVKTLLNFREKGGQFYKKKDLQKIYGLSETLFKELEPFIQIQVADKKTFAKAEKKEHFDSQKEEASKPVIIDINKASAAEWQQLSGVGATYAKRIVSFREKLGGFATIALVGETYGIPDSTFQKVKPCLKLSPVLKKIKINTVTAEELKVHPFIKWKQATAVIYYRQNHGNFTGIGDFKKVRALNAETIKKMEPYLDFMPK